MDMPQFLALQTQVLWAAFAVSIAFGVLAQRTNFCTMGAISDIFNIGSWTRMRMWGMAAGVAMLGFYLIASLGWINPAQSIYAADRVLWLSALIGGLMFGFGMVLASGCGSKTLVRIGEGNLKSLVVFFVMGLAAFATMRGMTALLRGKTIDQVGFTMGDGSSIPAWLASSVGMEPVTMGLLAALVAGGGLILWALWDPEFRTSGNSLLAGLGIGATIVAMWWITGHLGFVPEHPETMEPVYLGGAGGRMQAFSFTSPMARTLEWFLFFDASKALTLGVVSVFGVVLGSLIYALYTRTFQWEGFHGTRDTALHIVGAVFMGIGGVTAGGCTVGQGLSGISTLSLSSVLVVMGLMAGGVLGLRLQMWLLLRDD